jgi:preprotein translocase subunit Sec61beta
MTDQQPVRKGSLWRTIVAVGWSFLGIRKSSEFQEDIAKITPQHILGVGLVAGLLFVAGLMLIVNLVVAKS